MMLFDYLRTPMAAPETRMLKTMRLTILIGFASLAVLVACIQPARALVGDAAAGAVVGLLILLALIGPIYVGLKNRADDEHLDALSRRRGEA